MNGSNTDVTVESVVTPAAQASATGSESVPQLASQAATRAGVEVRLAHDVVELEAIDRLFARTWGGEEQDAVSVNMMKALAHSGQYVAAAWREGAVVGATVGFSWGPESPGWLHSHIAGVTPEAQGQGVGLALKLHQAKWALDHRIHTITWTYDPLIRRNAWFNIVKLGARAESYHPNFYGRMTDGINSGEQSDRCMAVWDLTSPNRPDRNLGPDGGAAGAPVLLAESDHGRPVLTPGTGDMLLCQVPADVVALRQKSPELATEWRMALRNTMGRALDSGYVATSVTRQGHYVLQRRVP